MPTRDRSDLVSDWHPATMYRYSGRVVSYDALRDEVEVEAAGLLQSSGSMAYSSSMLGWPILCCRAMSSGSTIKARTAADGQQR